MTGRFGLPMERESVSQSEHVNVRKPHSLTAETVVMPFAPASPAEASRIAAGMAELRRLGWRVAERASIVNDGYFAGTLTSRRSELVGALEGHTTTPFTGTPA